MPSAVLKQVWERFARDTLPGLLADPEWWAAMDARRKRRPALYWMAVRGHSKERGDA